MSAIRRSDIQQDGVQHDAIQQTGARGHVGVRRRAGTRRHAGISRIILKAVCAVSTMLAVCAGSIATIAPALADDTGTSAAGGATSAADSATTATTTATTVSNVAFQWGVNDETGGGAYFGGCNFLSAGVAGDNGASGVWQESKGFYTTKDGNVEILKPSADGTLAEPTWATKCTNQYGTNISGITAGMTFTPADNRKDPNAPADAPAAQPTYSGNVVRISNGSGTVDPATDSAHIEWEGSFTIVYYGGMTYWSLSNPVLDVKNGKGTITATASGYGADMDDPTIWRKLESRTIHLADFQRTAIDVSDTGIEATPDFLGVRVPDGVSGRNDQTERTDANAAWWGAFPESWLQYATLTGQTSYWWTSAGDAKTIQPRKPASPITIAWGGSDGGDPLAKVKLTASATSVAPGETITFTIGNAAKGVEYVVSVVGPDGRPGSGVVTADVDDATKWTYAVPADALTGTYTAELREQGSDAGGDAVVASVRFTVGMLPGAPTLTSHDTAGADRVELFWNAPKDAGKPALSGFVAIATPQGAAGGRNAAGGQSVRASFGASERSGMLTGLDAATTYDITIAAVNAVGVGPVSNTMTVTTADNDGGGGNGGGNGGNDNGGGNGGGDAGEAATTITNATLRWGMNDETNSAAFFGGCNFMSAGVAANTGASKVWDSSFYKASDGNVSIVKPNAKGEWTAATWQTKCQTRDGSAVKMAKRADGRSVNTESQVVITGGSGAVRKDGTTTISWKGSWNVVYYGGMTYWTLTDPTLTLDANGNGSLTATASGYGASMADSSKWVTLKPRQIHVADFSGGNAVNVQRAVSDHGFTATPNYLGVKVTASGDHGSQAVKDSVNAAYWGAFPQSFVDFQMETGQSAYWYTSNSSRDFAKPTLPLSVQFDSTYQVDAGDGSPTASGSGLGSGLGSVGSGLGSLLGTGDGSGNADGSVGAGSGSQAGGSGTGAGSGAGAADDSDGGAGAASGSGTGGSSGADVDSSASAFIVDNAGTIALGSGGVAVASALPLGIGWMLRRRLGLSASDELDRRLGLL